MAGFVVRIGSEETPRWCFRPRFLGFVTLLLLVLARSTSAGVLGRERTQEGIYDHTLSGDVDKHHHRDKRDTYHYDNASQDDIEVYDSGVLFLKLAFWIIMTIVILSCYACYKCKERSRVVLIRQHIPVPVEDPAASQTRRGPDSGAAATPSAGTEHPADDAPPAYSAVCPEASRAPQ